MELTLYRKRFTSDSTFGELSVNGEFECYTLEDLVREVKIPKKTAIPTGRYEIILTLSNRFKKILPLLLNVPHFTGVRIHSGNTDEDTEGCILVGQSEFLNSIGDSRAAMASLQPKLASALKEDKVFITVSNPREVL